VTNSQHPYNMISDSESCTSSHSDDELDGYEDPNRLAKVGHYVWIMVIESITSIMKNELFAIL